MIIEALTWIPATVSEIHDEATHVKTFRLTVDIPYPYLAGQHTIARVTLPNGFKSSRDYSFSSAPSSGYIEITIAKEPEGEVSGWFHDICIVGNSIEITMPLGSAFTWSPTDSHTPHLLIAHGIGVTPFASMLREATHAQVTSPTLLYGARTEKDICFNDELRTSPLSASTHITLSQPTESWQGMRGRIDESLIKDHLTPQHMVYICGTYKFVDDMKQLLLSSCSVTLEHIKIEQFN